MKCPHCQKEITVTDPFSPEALLLHIEARLQLKKRHAQRYLNTPENEQPYRVKHNLQKWQKWADWVRENIEKA